MDGGADEQAAGEIGGQRAEGQKGNDGIESDAQSPTQQRA